LSAKDPFLWRVRWTNRDSGEIVSDGRLFHVFDAKRIGDSIIHLVEMPIDYSILYGAKVKAKVDGVRQKHTQRNHTATHLLHKALRTVLGEHVVQKGSLVAPDRLRFDFSHYKQLTEDELKQIEKLVNEQILLNRKVKWKSCTRRSKISRRDGPLRRKIWRHCPHG